MFGPSSSHCGEENLDSSSDEEDGAFQSIHNDFEQEMRREMESHTSLPIPGTTPTAKEGELDENDELLYDQNADDEDEKWVENKRRMYLGLSGDSEREPTKRETQKGTMCPESDAVLNCPGCMTVLCLDCQRHEIYKTQYRAMFALNCNIDWSEKVESKNQKGKGKRRNREEKCEMNCKSLSCETDSYFNVRCSVCNTQVAVYDEDEVFHFFNVLSSYS